MRPAIAVEYGKKKSDTTFIVVSGVLQLGPKLERRVGIVPRAGAIVVAPHDAPVGSKANCPGDKNGMEPAIVHGILQVVVGRLLDLHTSWR